MALRVYASRDKSKFDAVRALDIHRYGDFYVAAVPRELAGDFEIVATVSADSFNIEQNKALISYDDITDLLENAARH